MHKPKPQIIIFGLLAVALMSGFFILAAKTNHCNDYYRDDDQLSVGGKVINVQIAKSFSEQSKGLGGRNCLAPNRGMLFVFDKTGYYPFWMKDMKFSIDIVWIDKNNYVIDTAENVKPNSYPRSYVNQAPAKKVLELPAGKLNQLDIRSGTKIN